MARSPGEKAVARQSNATPSLCLAPNRERKDSPRSLCRRDRAPERGCAGAGFDHRTSVKGRTFPRRPGARGVASPVIQIARQRARQLGRRGAVAIAAERSRGVAGRYERRRQNALESATSFRAYHGDKPLPGPSRISVHLTAGLTNPRDGGSVAPSSVDDTHWRRGRGLFGSAPLSDAGHRGDLFHPVRDLLLVDCVGGVEFDASCGLAHPDRRHGRDGI